MNIALLCGQPLGASEGPSRPNILFAIADDWGRDAGAYGTRWVRTPGFDRVAREGLLFNHAYTPNAKCAPSRAILLTGRLRVTVTAAAGGEPTAAGSWPGTSTS